MNWDVPQTEEGLQQVLRQIEECRGRQDLDELGRGLLALAHLVKWVRSDTETAPFLRSHEVATEAEAVFRRSGNERGLVRALLARVTPFVEPAMNSKWLEEAETVAEKIGDDALRADVLLRRAQILRNSDPKLSDQLYSQALEAYRQLGKLRGQAICLSAIALGCPDQSEKRRLYSEAIEIYKELGDAKETARSYVMLLMYSDDQPKASLEPIALEGLGFSQAAGERSLEQIFYKHLIEIKEAQGLTEEAKTYRRWWTEIEESDGRTPIERWKEKVEMTKMLMDTSRIQGDKDGVKAFREELKRLKAERPPKRSASH